MGGMIVQTMAITVPRRVRSLTSIMSTTGKRTVGWQHPTLLPTLLTPRNSRDDYITGSAQVWKIISSPAYPLDQVKGRERAADTYDRGVPRSGVLRQMMAVLKQPNRSVRLRSLHVPALVIHGLADKMVHVSGGRATAAAISGAVASSVSPPAVYASNVPSWKARKTSFGLGTLRWSATRTSCSTLENERPVAGSTPCSARASAPIRNAPGSRRLGRRSGIACRHRSGFASAAECSAALWPKGYTNCVARLRPEQLRRLNRAR